MKILSDQTIIASCSEPAVYAVGFNSPRENPVRLDTKEEPCNQIDVSSDMKVFVLGFESQRIEFWRHNKGSGSNEF